ncbi:MAG: hypothetical protein ACK2UO_02415 [Caldilineaceae bacterium]
MKNVLIVSQRFPPVNHIASRRFGYMVQFMEEFGWKPWILTQPGTGELSVPIATEQILPIPARTRKPITKTDQIPALAGIRFRYDVFASSWYWGVLSQRKELDQFTDPHIIVASYGPNSALWIGRFLSKRYQVPWIADFRDPGALRIASNSRIANSVDGFLERLSIRTASGITTAGEMWSEMTAAAYNLPAQTIYNGYRWNGHELTATQTAQPTPDAGDYVYYAGTVYNHQLPAFRVLLDSLVQMRHLRLRLRLLGVQDAVQTIARWVHSSPVRGRVDLLDRCSPEVALQEANRAFCNLVLGELADAPSWTRGHLTGKFLELLALNPPVLVVADQQTEFSRVLSITDSGGVCSNEMEVLAFLRAVASGHCYLGDPVAIESYSKRSQCRNLCEFLDKFVSS